MFRFTALSQASKASGTTTKYQARPSRDKNVGFKTYLGKPMLKGQPIVYQRRRIDHRFGYREPDYHPGNNVTMHVRNYDITADVSGVPTVRQSKINPTGYEWIDVEPDIQKVYRTQQLRRFMGPRGGASAMAAQHNARYVDEEDDLREPDWRQRVIRKVPLTERFPDPNLLTRGIVKSIEPKARFYYE
jgi:hypothetical protein